MDQPAAAVVTLVREHSELGTGSGYGAEEKKPNVRTIEET